MLRRAGRGRGKGEEEEEEEGGCPRQEEPAPGVPCWVVGRAGGSAGRLEEPRGVLRWWGAAGDTAAAVRC